MDCEMCGKKQATSVTMIEGVRLSVCADCARHGQTVKQILQPVKPKKAAAIAAQEARRVEERQAQREEFIETVRPDIAKILRQEREKRKLNMEQFAAKLQIRASTYHHYESGTTKPDTEMARKIEKVVGMPLVVHMKVSSSPAMTPHEEQRGLMLGDFVKRKK